MAKNIIRWNGYCQRCFKKTDTHIMSWYSQYLMCMECSDKENKRDDIKEAKKAEYEAVKSGNYNYEGIGYSGKMYYMKNGIQIPFKNDVTKEEATKIVLKGKEKNTLMEDADILFIKKSKKFVWVGKWLLVN